MNATRLPSLTALRAFVAAGRCLSFSRAADELHVTQSAVSRQIRTLEDELGVALFRRLTRRIELTDAGRAYLANIEAAFDAIQMATARISGQEPRVTLTISVLPTVGTFWLMSRLSRFSQQHPHIETRIISSIEAVDLQGREADVAIRVGAVPGKTYPAHSAKVNLVMVKNWEGVNAEVLAPDILVPIYGAKLGLDRPPVTPADVCRLPLIHTSSRPEAWHDWAKAHAMPAPRSRPGMEFGHFFMSIEAAREGLGLAIIPDILLGDPMMREFTALHDLKVPSAGDYCLLTLQDRQPEPHIQQFRHWLLEQFETFDREGERAVPA